MIPRLAERAREVTAAQRARGLDTEGSWWRRGRGVLAVTGADRARCGAARWRRARWRSRHAASPAPAARRCCVSPPIARVQRLARWGMFAALIAAGRLARLPGIAAVLSLRAVSYRYPGAKHDALHGIDLEPGGGHGHRAGRARPKPASRRSASWPAAWLHGWSAADVAGHVAHRRASTSRAGPCTSLAEDVVTGIQDPAGQLSLIAETVFEEVAFGPANLGLPRDEVIERRVEAALRTRRASTALRERDPVRLSGGQQQLVVVAGLLAMRPRVTSCSTSRWPTSTPQAARLVLDAVRPHRRRRAAVLLAEQRSGALAGGGRLGAARGRRQHRRARASAPRCWPTPPRTPSAWRSCPGIALAPAARRGRPRPIAGGGGQVTRACASRASPSTTPTARVRSTRGPGSSRPGTSLALIGANGSGKTTLARHLNGLLRPSARACPASMVRTRRTCAWPSWRGSVGLCFQQPDRQIFGRNVRDEVEFGPRHAGLEES